MREYLIIAICVCSIVVTICDTIRFNKRHKRLMQRIDDLMEGTNKKKL